MITLSQKISSLKREIAMRERVYPGQVRAGKMRQSEADLEIATMKAILADYLMTSDDLVAA